MSHEAAVASGVVEEVEASRLASEVVVVEAQS
jgi:hypothetical protein